MRSGNEREQLYQFRKMMYDADLERGILVAARRQRLWILPFNLDLLYYSTIDSFRGLLKISNKVIYRDGLFFLSDLLASWQVNNEDIL